jgi:hypothetical protein
MKPATASADNGAFSVPKYYLQTGRYLDTIPPCRYLVEFALRARNITTLGALATQFHEKCGLTRIFHEACYCERR